MRVHARLSDETLRLTLDDEAHGNALSLAGAAQIERALRAHDGAFREIVVDARGRFFCAGANLRDHSRLPDAGAGRAANREIARILELLEASPRPTLALAQGDCLGGGLEFVSTFDCVIAAPEACFGFWQRRVGLSFAWGGGGRLAKRLPAGALRRLAMDAPTMTAAQALRIGLIDEIAYASQLEARAQAWIARMRRWAQAPLGTAKRAAAFDGGPGERAAVEELWWGEEHRAVLETWGSKVPVDFSPRGAQKKL